MGNRLAMATQVIITEILNLSFSCSHNYHHNFVCVAFEGGPLIQKNDGTLIGITSGGRTTTKGIFFKKTTPTSQEFTKIHYYFDWIEEKTGLELPKCGYDSMSHSIAIMD